MNKSDDIFVRKLIKEYATYNDGGYELLVKDLPLSEIKIFLSHILSAEDYEDALENPTRTSEYIRECNQEMQKYIDNLIDDVHHDYMNDCGFSSRRLSNGDIIWIRQ